MTFFILIPVYKVEKYIRTCIESVLNQTYQNFHVILVDDGSPDQSGPICDEYAQKDRRVHVIHQKNQGQLSARETALRFVKGTFDCENDYFLFLDSDDSYKENALAVIAQTIAQHNCDMVVFGVDRISDEGKLLKPLHSADKLEAITDSRQLLKKVYCNWDYNPLWRKAIKCTCVPDVDYTQWYAIRHGEDLLQSIDIYNCVAKTVFIPDRLYNYRQNPSSITHSVSAKNYDVNSAVRARVWDNFTRCSGMTEADRDAYLGFCRKLLKGEISMISTLEGTAEEIETILAKITEDSYYRMLLSGSKRDVMLRLMQAGNYRWVIRLAQAKAFLKRVYHALRGKNFNRS